MGRVETVPGQLAVLTLLLLGLPLLGIALSGRPVTPYLEFPPLTERITHRPFDWTAFVLVGAAVLFLAALLTGLLRRPAPPGTRPRASPTPAAPLPVWGKVSVVWLLLAWWLAWNQAGWTEPLQPLKFPLLWLGYIGVVNAWTFRRSGRCLWHDRPLHFTLLFPVSALFWWYFEYLNRFVQNWHYLGVEDYTSGEYILYSTLAFSTVLPAVMSTAALLRTFPVFERPRYGPVMDLSRPRVVAGVVLALSALGLTAIGIWPDYLFPLLWGAPLLIIVALQTLSNTRNYFAPLAAGDWRVVVIPACAALACGMCWEMWNYYSWPKWSYSVPMVQRFELFEMPLLGYAGYLPFGLECAAAADLLQRIMRNGDGAGDKA